jgi:5-methylcytosine-specific restriction enzyme A
MSGFPPPVRERVRERAGRVGPWVCCERCGEWADTIEVHHRRPRGMGGSRATDTNLVTNALALCPACHRHIEDHRDEAHAYGWLVAPGDDPADIPVVRRQMWARLLPDGGVDEPEVPWF